MEELLYPSAFSTPISVRWASTIRVMVVMHTRAATRKKKIGKTLQIPSTMEESLSKHAYPVLAFRSST